MSVEVQIMRGTNHPGIVKLLQFSEASEYYFLVLERQWSRMFYVESHADVSCSCSLRGWRAVPSDREADVLQREPRKTRHPPGGARYQVSPRGARRCASVRRLHILLLIVWLTTNSSDIKPENLLFDRIPIVPSKTPVARPYDEEKEDEGEFIPGIGGGGIGRVKIADFGLSKVVWDEQTMTPCGTVGYTAPEIVKDERYSKSVDMWAMGCVLYTLLCGFPPFYDESINVLTEKVARGYYTFLSPWWDDISATGERSVRDYLPRI